MPLTLRNFNRIPQPITVPWIYYNSRARVISLSSDWTNWMTIADRNLGATQIYNDWDALSISNCGNFFQWWNNYHFPFTWAINTSSDPTNASMYWPWNYFSDPHFRTGNEWQLAPLNYNLWWDTTDTNEARRWPCVVYSHVPSDTEWWSLIDIMVALWLDASWNDAKTYLKMPQAWRLVKWDGTYSSGYWYYWSTTVDTNEKKPTYLSITSTMINWLATNDTYWYSIRPFFNTPVQPDDWWEWEELYIDREYIEYKIITGADALVWIEWYWIWNTWERNNSFDWYVSVNWWVEVHATWPAWANISWPRSYNEEVTVRIRPATRTYWWARAFWWYWNPHNSITEVIFDWSYMWYADSATDTWNYFRSNQYNWCAMLRNAPEEYLPDTVTTIGTYFRNQQFYWCSILPYAPVESLPNNVFSIGWSFRNGQYGNCTWLTQIRWWKDINLTVSTYRVDQFAWCTNNKTVKVLSDAMASSSTDTLDNDYVTQVKVPTTYLNNFKNFNDAPRSLISDSKFVWY